METIQIQIKAEEPDQEILVSLLSDLGATGFEQKEDHLLAYFPSANFNSHEVNEIIRDREHSVQVIDEQNWNAVWESNFSPVVVDDFCAVRADFHDPVTSVRYEIMITPKMSFGTGHHATTYMMMRQMKDIDFKGRNVFDFGTGTGILAILAEKLGAASISAIDVDDWSIRNAGENIKLNHCSRISISLSTNLPLNKFDIILANINRNVIIQYMEGLKKILVPGGQILFSGLLTTDQDDIMKAVGDGLVLMHREEKENWLSLLFILAKQPV